MTDIFTEQDRSRVMRAVHGKDTQPERALRSALHRAGYRFRIHRTDLPGKPDIVLPRFGTVIFVNGCFWHQHPGCRKATIPQNNRTFWRRKLRRTVKRDAENKRELADQGWRVITVWECEMHKSMEATMKRIIKKLRRSGRSLRRQAEA